MIKKVRKVEIVKDTPATEGGGKALKTAFSYRKAGKDHELIDAPTPGKGAVLSSEAKLNLTLGQAKKFLNYSDFRIDQGLRQSHVENLITSMHRGEFYSSWVTFVICTCDEQSGSTPAGEIIRLNGKHTCFARLEMPADYRCQVRVQRYHCKTDHDVRRLYNQIDRNAIHSKSNGVLTGVFGTEGFESATRRTITHLGAGITRWLWPPSTASAIRDPDTIIYQILTVHRPACVKVAKFLGDHKAYSGGQFNHLWRAGVCAAMIETFSKAPRVAADFWEVVASGVGITESSDPRSNLRNGLIQHGVGTTRRSQRKPVDAETMYRWCVGHWNAHRDGKPMSQLRTYKERPVAK